MGNRDSVQGYTYLPCGHYQVAMWATGIGGDIVFADVTVGLRAYIFGCGHCGELELLSTVAATSIHASPG